MSRSTKREKTFFQKKLHSLMFENDLTIRKLSNGIGVKEITVQFWRTGMREPSVHNARRLSNFFSISLDDLFGPLPSGSGT